MILDWMNCSYAIMISFIHSFMASITRSALTHRHSLLLVLVYTGNYHQSLILCTNTLFSNKTITSSAPVPVPPPGTLNECDPCMHFLLPGTWYQGTYNDSLLLCLQCMDGWLRIFRYIRTLHTGKYQIPGPGYRYVGTSDCELFCLLVLYTSGLGGMYTGTRYLVSSTKYFLPNPIS